MNTSDNDYIESLNNATIFLYKYITLLVYILGNIGNLVSLSIFFKKSWRKNVCVFYFVTYIFFGLCYINSSTLASILSIGYNIGAQNFNVVLCKIFVYAAFIFATVSPTVLILASIDRLLISSQNVDTRLYSSRRLAYFSLSISILCWIVFNIHILVKANIIQLAPSIFVCYYDLTKSYLDFVFYFLMTIHTVFGLIMSILSILSFKNVQRIRIIPRQQRSHVRSMKKKDFQLLRCLFVQDIIFLIFSLLINGYFVYQAATRDQARTSIQQAIDSFVDNLLTSLYNIPYCANFFVFVTVSKAFRCELKRSIYNLCGKDLMIPREEENKQENILPSIAVVNCD